MIGFHLFYLEMFAADGTDSFLLLILAAFGIAVKCTELQMMLVSIKDVPIDTFLVNNVGVLHEVVNTCFQIVLVDVRCAVLIVDCAPVHTFHHRAIGEGGLHPVDDLLKIEPESGCVFVLYGMLRHVLLYLSSTNPVENGLQVVLLNR